MKRDKERSVRGGAIIAAIALLCFSCGQEPKRTVIARVGDAELTLEVARSHIDSSRGSADFQLREYAAAWCTTELLYQEAHRLGIDASPEFVNQLADTRRQLVNEHYLATLFSADTAEIPQDTLTAFFKTHEKEFLVRENMIKLHGMICANREQASNFAANVVQRGSWGNAARAVLADSTLVAGSFMELPAQYYSQQTLYPPELWKVASSLGVNEVSFPVKVGEKYYVLQMITAAQQGRPADIEIVQDEVRQRIVMERRRKQYADLLGTLRSRRAVEILLGGSTLPDTNQSRLHE